MTDKLNTPAAGYGAMLSGTSLFIKLTKFIIIMLLVLVFIGMLFVAFDSDLRVRFFEGEFAALFDAEGIAGILSFVVVYFFLQCLGKIIASAQNGDPFIVENTKRLRVLGWLFLAIGLFEWYSDAKEVIGYANVGAGAVAGGAGYVAALITGAFITLVMSPAAVLASPLMFILARVFDAGIAMREDVEGTV